MFVRFIRLEVLSWPFVLSSARSARARNKAGCPRFDGGMTDDSVLRGILAAHHFGTLATIKRDGRPQLSTVNYLYDADAGAILISITAPRAKTKNLQRDPRATFHVATGNSSGYVVVEGTAVLTPTAARRDDDTVNALVDHYRRARGEHPDWDEFRDAMVADQRVLLTIPIERLYGLQM
jgi:PPOX class probable F420-dependent enzyme